MSDQTPTKPDRAKVIFELDAELVARFRARFPGRGDRSIYLRRAVQQAIGDTRAGVTPTVDRSVEQTAVVRRAEVVQVRLYADQIAGIEREAAAMGMKPSQWMRAVLDARLNAGSVELSPEDRLALNQAARIVRKIGNNHNQLTQAAKRAAVNGKPIMPALPILEELAATLASLRSKFDTVLVSRRRYWRGKLDE